MQMKLKLSVTVYGPVTTNVLSLVFEYFSGFACVVSFVTLQRYEVFEVKIDAPVSAIVAVEGVPLESVPVPMTT